MEEREVSVRWTMCSFEGTENDLAWWLSWLERRPVTAEVVGSNPIRVVLVELWDLSSAGRASALQAEGHRFEPCRSHYFTLVCRRQVHLMCRCGSIGRAADL